MKTSNVLVLSVSCLLLGVLIGSSTVDRSKNTKARGSIPRTSYDKPISIRKLDEKSLNLVPHHIHTDQDHHTLIKSESNKDIWMVSYNEGEVIVAYTEAK